MVYLLVKLKVIVSITKIHYKVYIFPGYTLTVGSNLLIINIYFTQTERNLKCYTNIVYNMYYLPDMVLIFDQYKKYTIRKYHHENIMYIHCLSLDQISMICGNTRIIILNNL